MVASRKPVAFSGLRQRATRPASTNESPAVAANTATSHGLSSWELVKTSAIAMDASTSAATAATPNRKALTGAET